MILAIGLVLAGPGDSLLFAQENAQADYSSLPDIEAAYGHFKLRHQAAPSYETDWKFALACSYYAWFIIPEYDGEARKAVLFEGKSAAQDARASNPEGVEGWLYYVVCLGSWAEANGLLVSFLALGELFSCAEQAVRIDDSFFEAAPLMARARLYHKSPGWPFSLGDRRKAESDYLQVLKLAPLNRIVYRYYAELLIEDGRLAEAAELIEKGLAAPPVPGLEVLDRREITNLEKLRPSRFVQGGSPR